MTEEIIIDGVDVAGCHNKTPYKNDYGDVQCKCYRFEDIENNTFLFGICKQHPNCYYKQFKRLEQENKELRKANEISIEKVTVTAEAKRLQELEQENRELKEKVKSLESEIRQKKMTIMMNNDHYLTVDENNRKYNSALEEIREIVMESKPVDEPISQTEFTVRRMDLQTNKLIRVLAKINEVLGNENN